MKTKQNLKSFVKLFVLLMGVSVLLWNCEKEENNHIHQEHQITKVSALSIEDLPDVASALSGLNKTDSNKNKNSTHRSMDTDFGSLSLTNILEYANENGQLTYSFSIKKDFPDNGFENLHLVKLEDGYLAFILKWESDEDWLKDNNYNFVLSDFTGTKTHYDLDYNIIQITEFANGQSIDDSTSNKTDSTSFREYYMVCTTDVVNLCTNSGSNNCGGNICGFGNVETCSLAGGSGGGYGGLDSLAGGAGTRVPRTSGGSTGVTEDGDAIVVPVVPIQLDMEINTFFNNLTQDQKEWLATPFNPTVNAISTFFEENQILVRDYGGPTYDGPLIDDSLKEFAEKIIEELKNNPSVSNEDTILMIDFFTDNDWVTKLKNALAIGITTTAELTHDIYNKMTEVINNHPSSLSAMNIGVKGLKSAVELVTDTNPQTADWSDLFNMWMFELGSNPTNFDGDDTTTLSLKIQEGVSQARTIALQQVSQGNLNIQPHVWVYGQGEFYDGITNGNITTAFLGSYSTSITVTQNTNGTVTLTFNVSNTSGWASATRLRIDNDNNGQHDEIIPDKGRGTGILLGGNFIQNWSWSETH